MTTREDELAVLARGLDQAAGIVDTVEESDLARSTPCADWTVSALVDHLVVAPARFAQMVRGEEVDWSAPTPSSDGHGAEELRRGAAELMEAWRAVGSDDVSMGPDWQSAEVAIHTYDLVAALGRPTDGLDQEVADRGLAFMKANLQPQMREPAFDAEQSAPEDADAYQRIAAFAGRAVAAG
jgi:uncharacterized protein (TIGR03086 family)